MPLPPLISERFRLLRPLNDALYGSIGLYEDIQHNSEPVAIKQVSLARAVAILRVNPNMDNPWSEHRVVSHLMALPPHTNIVRVRGEFLHLNDTWCVVMEFCPGGDLWSLLESQPNNRLPELEACQLFLQCVRGVRFLHAQGIAHRDLSLENIFCSRGVCKIGDFGLSTNVPLRGCGETVGKAYYMAPEVVNQEAYDAFSADVWSLGIMLFIMLTGSPLTSCASRDNKAFNAFCKLGVAKIIVSWGLSDRISPATVGLIDRLLSIDPSDRPTIDELYEILEARAKINAQQSVEIY
ncbi:serine threonine protein kinase [Plasmopara halstedii]|uniref:Serine threonine protein kinase n=1 Tax=Plasmopara halstedii TaxID=4781 RepID=A0A0N7L6U9_PLAHL|nr:serine threonine protein kinase [Plasmopara halstedii]CEG45283.1 serine threonine protein kinase [Plasmopara halstedii]|eukprot:XP_024581652.1 serine threonine protein kinase [Plasmopara halstedii]